MLQKLKQRDEGFTIIETMIVLAIAALIMLIVFLAVPALERNSRNTQRTNDVSNILSAINTEESNTGGALITSGTLATAVTQTKLGYYQAANVYLGTGPATLSAPTANPGPTTLTTEDVVVLPGYSCNTNGQNGAPTTSTARSLAIEYVLEASSGDGTLQCESD